MAGTQSRTQKDLEARLLELKHLPTSDARRVALVAAVGFKASWVELGRALVAARDSKAYGSWGYRTFEAYCKDELHIRQDTVQKLTRSFSYLQHHAPEQVHRAQSGLSAPPLDVVDLLSQAASRTKVSQGAIDALSREVWSDGGPKSRASVLKQLRVQDPEAFRAKPVAEPEAIKEAAPEDLRKALALAERLVGLLQQRNTWVSDGAQAKLNGLLDELRRASARETPNLAVRHDSNLSEHHEMH